MSSLRGPREGQSSFFFSSFDFCGYSFRSSGIYFHCVLCMLISNILFHKEENICFFFSSWSLTALLFILLRWSQPLRGVMVGQETSDTPWP